ncbi:MAG: KpsF/GutQ family sugar-phosphate isomerase [Phycisphaera sp.]|nr:KpsF/GutQ family sugar-phosphate isomerase [Phycisphaera sp.]
MNKAPDPATPKISPSQRASQQALAEQVLRTESEAISRVGIDERFHRAVELILNSTASSDQHGGSVVVSGLGKSGLIGQKLSATFASTGTHSHFLHPVEAMHGDLGRVRKNDVVLLLSYGGNTEEVVTLATILRQDAVPVIAIVGRPGSELSRLATETLTIGDVTEACPLNLAPTASTTAMLALGDALALCVSQRRNFDADDFRKVHPGGALGRQLLPVVDVMRFKAAGDQPNLPLIPVGVSVERAYQIADEQKGDLRRAGALIIVNKDRTLAGILTDGDLRRLVFTHGRDALTKPIEGFMTQNPRRLASTALVRDAVQLIREHRIDELPVVDAKSVVVGLIDVQDLMALKVIEG